MKSKHSVAGNVLHLPPIGVPKIALRWFGSHWLPADDDRIEIEVVSILGRWYALDYRPKPASRVAS
jgi:hypothetical protein